MPEKKIIHVRQDVDDVLWFADSIGLHLLPDRLENEDVRPWQPEAFRSLELGTIYIFRPEWVEDTLQPMLIESGAYAGTYVVRGTNFSRIDLSFSREKDIDGVCRLSPGSISFKRDFLHEKSHEMHLSPPEVEQTYKQLCKHMFSKISVRGGVHKYHVCKEAAELATRIPTRPPFDYIPWPPPDLKEKMSLRKRGKAM